jgi:hypothetical protein
MRRGKRREEDQPVGERRERSAERGGRGVGE